MHAILEELKQGSTEIGPLYKRCVAMWSAVLDDADGISVDELAERLSGLQTDMEIACDWNRALAKSIMAFSGFSYLYDYQGGFENNEALARKLQDAFEKSHVSLEVKFDVEKAVGIFFYED